MPEPISTAATFLLSPANLSGVRGRRLLAGLGDFPLARTLAAGNGVPLGEIFSFVSGLYFRGKLSYARHFSSDQADRIRIITSNGGLRPPGELTTVTDLAGFEVVDLDPADARYVDPLRRDLATLPAGPVIFLGSLATAKYLEVLVPALGDRLLVPGPFLGLGDMSRGALLLDAVRRGRELPYRPGAPLWPAGHRRRT